MDFASNTVGTEANVFVDLGLLSVNTLDEFNTFGPPTTRIRRTTDGTYWSALSVTRSKLGYKYKLILKFGGKIRTLDAKTFQ